MISNEKILNLAAMSGATDINGKRATNVFCFTEQEVIDFSKRIAKECADLIDDGNGAMSSIAENVWCNACRDQIKNHFGIN